MTLNIQAYFDDDRLRAASDINSAWILIGMFGDPTGSLSENQKAYTQAPDQATHVLDLLGCELNEGGQLKKIKEVKVVKGQLDDMEEQHPEVMKTLRDLTDRFDEVDEKTGIGNVHISLDKGFYEEIKRATDEAIEMVKEKIENKPEQLYYVKLTQPFDTHLTYIYLNFDMEENNFFFNNSENDEIYKTKFTSSELDNIQKQLPFLNIGLLKVPVEDEQ